MAEALPAFVARRRPDWTRLESLVQRSAEGPLPLHDLEALDALYRRLASDLSLAQTRWAGTDVHRFLNQLSTRAWTTIYRPPPTSLGTVKTFFLETFPSAVRATRGPIGLAAGLLLLGVVLGALSVWLAPDTTRALVDAGLREFIDRQALWTDAALDDTSPTSMAVMIFLNNLKVIFGAFALGITGGLGTALVLLFNGVSLGATFAACARGGVGARLLEFISAHGPIELSLIAIAGGAGLHLGGALIGPGERSRAQALKDHAQRSVQLLLGAAPFMVLIGVVEGFVSPGPLFPWPLKAAVGLLSGFAFWRWLLRPARASSPRRALP